MISRDIQHAARRPFVAHGLILCGPQVLFKNNKFIQPANVVHADGIFCF